MDNPLGSYRVLEVATWGAAPAGGGLLSDLGFEVIKVEPPLGDPTRAFVPPGNLELNSAYTVLNPLFQFGNRNKRSVTLNLRHPDARPVLRDLIRSADVFLTNMLPARQEKVRLTYEDVRKENESIVYAALSGFGSRGPDRNRPGFDTTAFFARTGLMDLLGEEGQRPVLQRPGQGDHTTSITLAASIVVALLAREKTGKGQFVDVSLLGTGLWVMGVDVSNMLIAKVPPRRQSRENVSNPLWNTYLTKDNRWLLLSMAAYELWWPRAALALGLTDLVIHPDYATLAAIQQRLPEAVEMIARIIAERTLAEWGPLLDEQELAWSPVLNMQEALDDPQVREMQFIRDVEHPTQGTIRLPSTPFQMSELDIGPRRPAPEGGQHTEEVLLELGYSSERIDSLRESGTFGS